MASRSPSPRSPPEPAAPRPRAPRPSKLTALKRVGIYGGTGYTGAELVRLLAHHPDLELTWATSRREAGRPLREPCPWLDSDLPLSDPESDLPTVDGVFLSAENGVAATLSRRFLKTGAKVVDLSADYRLRDGESYERGYGKPHPDPNPEFTVAYGLPECGNRTAVAGADLVANPGCYPTATTLALWPLTQLGLLGGVPVVDAKSGVSGAGRSRATTEFLYAEGADDFRAYLPVGHRHTPEIEQSLGLPVRFTPHMVPMARGMQATVHAPLKDATTGEALRALLREAYANEPFVRVLDRIPETKAVRASNRCDLWADYDPRTGHAVLIAVIDNLVKGASGAALQNMNLLLDLPEASGLPVHGVWP